MITILAMGQSNASGAGAGGAWDMPISVTVWNNAPNSNSAVSGLGTSWVAAVKGSAPFYTDSGIPQNNMMAHAARHIANLTGQSVRLILVARGSTPIADWVSSAGVKGPMYYRMAAILSAAGVSAVDAFIWHQGEADEAAPANYATCWGHLLSAMASDSYITASTPIVIGELVPLSPNMNAVLRLIAAADARVGIAGISRFPTGNNVHFNGPSLWRAGAIYAQELSLLPGALSGIVPIVSPDGAYYAATGGAGVVFPSGTPVRTPVFRDFGSPTLSTPNGGFVSDRFGVWEFNAVGYTGGTKTFLYLMDKDDQIISFLSSAGNADAVGNDEIVSGSAALSLGQGDEVYLGASQGSGSTKTITEVQASRVARLTARYLGPN